MPQRRAVLPSLRRDPGQNLRRRADIDELELAKGDPIAVICGGGNRSSTAISLLLRSGYRDLYNVTGGMTAWRNAGFRMVDAEGQVCSV